MSHIPFERRRVANMRRLMRKRGMTSFLVTQRENVRYLTGFTGSSGVALVTRGSIALITDFRYQLQAKRETEGTRIAILKKDLLATVKETAASMGVSRLWFDESSLPVDRARRLKETGLRVKGSVDPVQEIRQRKDSREMRSIRTAVRRAEDSFEILRRFLRPGVSERQLALRLEFLMRERGAKRAAFDLIVASGPNGAMPHAGVSNRRLRAGDLVTVDFGAEADGYFCDITRTVCVGRPSTRQREIHELVLHAQREAIETIRPGIACKAVDHAARDIIASAGHGEHFGHATGHGIGLSVHEGPSVSALSKDVLQEGMVITVEPGIYIPGWGGVRIEDMVVVTDKGPRLLTSLRRDL